MMERTIAVVTPLVEYSCLIPAAGKRKRQLQPVAQQIVEVTSLEMELEQEPEQEPELLAGTTLPVAVVVEIVVEVETMTVAAVGVILAGTFESLIAVVVAVAEIVVEIDSVGIAVAATVVGIVAVAAVAELVVAVEIAVVAVAVEIVVAVGDVVEIDPLMVQLVVASLVEQHQLMMSMQSHCSLYLFVARNTQLRACHRLVVGATCPIRHHTRDYRHRPTLVRDE